jgi:CheY-like chemotaxis protein
VLRALLSVDAMKGDRDRCLASGMDDYISKPIGLPELARATRFDALTPILTHSSGSV